MLGIVAEFEAGLIRARTREGMAGRQSEGTSARQTTQALPCSDSHLVQLRLAGEHTNAEIAELFGVARSTVLRALDRATLSNSSETNIAVWIDPDTVDG